MFKISVGYNGKPGFAEVIAKYKEHVADIYFVAPFMPSGRGSPGDAGEQVYTLRLHELLKFAMNEGIRMNILFNALCLGEGYGSPIIGQALAETMQFYIQTYNIASATVVSVIDGELIKKRFPRINVHASVNMFIRNPHQALEVAHIADTIVLDRNVNRDLNLIREIKEQSGKHIRLLVNEACVPECMNRVQHFNRISHQAGDPEPFYLPCVQRYHNDPAVLFKSPIVRPEDVHHYEGLVDSIKIASRASDTEKIETMLRAYSTGTFDGNLFEIVESGGLDTFIAEWREIHKADTVGDPYLDNSVVPDDFHEHVTTCDRYCHKCNYCNEIAKKAFRWLDKAVEVKV